MTTYRIIVTGRVQGVGFRYYTCEKARSLSLKGTVKNLSDGSVEILVQGSKEPISQFLEWCHKGPPTALVSRLDYEATGPIPDEGFEILR